MTSRNVVFDENIPQGDIDFAQDDYWLEIRKSRAIESNKKEIKWMILFI